MWHVEGSSCKAETRRSREVGDLLIEHVDAEGLQQDEIQLLAGLARLPLRPEWAKLTLQV